MTHARLLLCAVVCVLVGVIAPTGQTPTPALVLNDLEYLEGRGVDILAFSNWYSGDFSDSKLSGVEIIHHGVRAVTNGDVRLSPAPGQWDPTPQRDDRRVNRAARRVSTDLSYPRHNFRYRVDVEPSGPGALVRVCLAAPVPTALEGKAGFNLEFLPAAYFGKSYLADDRPGMFARHPSGPMVVDAAGGVDVGPLATGSRFILAPEDPERRIVIDGQGASLALYDGRNTAQNGWYVLRSLLPAGKTGCVLQWRITPHGIPNWVRRRVIAHSQVGYHPAQPKVAVLESDPRDTAPRTVRLLAVEPDGRFTERLAGDATPWGRYLRFDYGRFDFTKVTQPGIYVLESGGVRTEPFRIAADVYQEGVWQPTLDTFLPVQMDHVLVNDRYRVWHGASHLDDARQAPVNHEHFDLYAQGPTTDTPYKPGQHIPGLNIGGWFDAGDFDIRTQSQYAVVLTLVHAREAFGIDRDQTKVDQKRRFVDLGQPDGVPDIVQQIEHGTLALIAQYRAVGHAIPGIVEPTLDQYTHLGDAVTKTDNLVYNPELDADTVRGGESGVPDDRWAFTTRTSALDYGSAAALAAASRVLRGHNDALADECLTTAVRVWDEEQGRPPATFRFGNTTGGRLEDEELRATVELLITTKGQKYADRLIAMWPRVEPQFGAVAAYVARALPHMDAAFRAKVAAAAAAYKTTLDADLAKNPFGVPISMGGWGGANGVMGFGATQYVLHRAFPDLFGPEYTWRALEYVLGTHPHSDVSFVSGVGARSMTTAYGANRADYAFIPGGVVPGVVLVKPDFLEIKEDWPFLWFENEYVITAGASFLYLAHAAEAALRDGQAAARPLYLDPDADAAARARDLVGRMTLEEKVSQLMNQAAAIPRLGVPAYEWWNEALHGVARAGVATVFPQAIGLAATFDVPLMHEIAEVIGNEGRAKHHQFVRQGRRGRYQGLTFWSPNINIFRDPRWGRGQETYGEDPYLTGQLGVAFVKGLQGDDPRYYRVIATAKHYAVHSGPEPDRHTFDARPTERDLWETYLPAFKMLVQDGQVASVMSAYNRINGESATASDRFLNDILRDQWGFRGYVVSDCGAVDDIFRHHKIVATAEEASALSITKGCDLECGGVFRSLLAAVGKGLVREADLDVALHRLFEARMRLGMFDPPERVKWAQIPYSVNDAPAHDQLARRVARSSMVLLKNDGALPLRKDLGTVAVIGPTANDLMSLLGNYNGTPARPVTILAGIRQAVAPGTRVLYERGTDLVEGRNDPRAVPIVETAYLRPAAGSAEHGLTGAYFRGKTLEGEPQLTRLDPKVEFRWDRGAPTDEPVARGELPAERGLPNDGFSVRWTGVLVPPASGEYEMVVTANDGARLTVDGRTIIDAWTDTFVARATSGRVTLEAGREYPVTLEYYENDRDAEVRLAWRIPGAPPPFEAALAAARAADAVVFVGGLTAEVEGEEMRVSYPGFAGGDRTDIELPAVQRKLLEALHATGKPVILVLTTGSAVGLRWAHDNLPGILVAWYPGQQGGNAVADVLFGETSPAGRLPVTFYESASQLPDFADYRMEGRTYRYFRGEPVYPFGHGLSYTTFEYANLRLSRATAGAGDRIDVTAEVRNTGARAGDEVVQLYVRAPDAGPAAAIRTLRGVERVSLAPGERKVVRFSLQPQRDMLTYDEARKALAVAPGPFEIEIGGSSRALPLRGRVSVK